LQPMAAFPTLLGPTDPLCIAGKVVVALPSYSSKSTNTHLCAELCLGKAT
jgi:hypothetical protein